MTKTGVLFSGGMDSFLAWKLYAPEADLVFVDCGQKYLHKEWQAVMTAGAGASIVSLQTQQIGLAELPSGIILHRNAALILAAACRGYNEIIMGVVADEINSDKSPEFLSAMATTLNISHRGQYWNEGVGVEYKIWSPIRRFTKTDLVRAYLLSGMPVQPLLQTVSCYDADNGQCGKCPSCFKRWVALVNNDIDQFFISDPLRWGIDQGVIKKARDGTYAPARAKEILDAMDKRCSTMPDYAKYMNDALATRAKGEPEMSYIEWKVRQ